MILLSDKKAHMKLRTYLKLIKKDLEVEFFREKI